MGFEKKKPHQFPVSDYTRPFPPAQPEPAQNRMFSGNKPMAYLDDLAALHGEVLHWLMGQSEEFGGHGYVPLLPDGTIDPKYIREEFVGVDVFNNKQNIAYNAKTLDFRGNLVKVAKESDGKLVIYIQKADYSHLGRFDGNTNGNLIFDKSTNFKEMICPYSASNQYYGVEAGTPIMGIASLDDLDNIKIATTEGIYFKDNENTKFVISLVDALDKPVFTVESARIVGNSTNVIMGDNRYCTMAITDFEKHDIYYKGNIHIAMNLGSYFPKSTFFKIKVTHFNSTEDIVTWESERYFYCKGFPVDTEMLDIGAKIYVNGAENTPQLKKVCGVTYVSEGFITFTVEGITNINNAAPVADKIKFESNIIDEEYVFSEEDMEYENVSVSELSTDMEATWHHTFKLKKPFLYPAEKVTATITIRNGYQDVVKTWSDIRIKSQLTNAYIDSLNVPYKTNRITEGFDGDVFESDETSYLDSYQTQFSDLTALDNSTNLQIIPGSGLVWPNFFGTRSVTYPVRYFKRVFTGNDSDTSTVWGGTFIFGNLTLEQFMRDDFTVKISLDNAATWYDLKRGKDTDDQTVVSTITGDTEVIKGILCETVEANGELAVRFALPEDQHFNHADIICFELSMKSTCTNQITYIKLRNEDNT